MIVQGTPEWHAARLGRVTASKIADVLMKPSTAGYQNYRSQLVCERLTGNPTETFTSAAMQNGTDTEPQARAMYSMTEGHVITEVGFVPHPTITMSGASPDGLVADDGLVEIKCPQPTEHIRVLTGGAIKRNYMLQMIWQMECTGRKWCDFVSFSPALPNEMQLFVKRVEQDAEQATEIREAIEGFLGDVDDLSSRLQKTYGVAA